MSQRAVGQGAVDQDAVGQGAAGYGEFELAEIVPPYDFEPALTQYVIYPWIREGEDGEVLARVLRLASGTVAKEEVRSIGTIEAPRLRVRVCAGAPLGEAELDEVRRVLRRCLMLDADPRPFRALCDADPVLRAAAGARRGGRGKLYPTVFEAVVGVICAQNTLFKRIYAMMHNLAAAFGPGLEVDGRTYHAFPDAAELAAASEEALRGCKVGYRAKAIRGVSVAVAERGIDLEALRGAETDEAREVLLSLPGIGPYTANLVLSVGLGRGTVHLDSFVRAIMSTFYFGGQPVSDEQILEYARTHWPGHESAAIGLLTTDTEVWAKDLGVDFHLRSGARG